jgi:hypothetical protein
LPQRREHDQSSVDNTRRSRDNRLGIVLIWATAAAALVEIKSAAATKGDEEEGLLHGSAQQRRVSAARHIQSEIEQRTAMLAREGGGRCPS